MTEVDDESYSSIVESESIVGEFKVTVMIWSCCQSDMVVNSEWCCCESHRPSKSTL